MSLSAAAIRILANKGLTASDIADVAEANEGQRSSAAVRQKRYRDNKRNERDVTRDVTVPPNERDILTPSVPISDEIGDPEKILFDQGIAILAGGGVKEPKARQLLGKWKRDHGAPTVISALSAAKREGAVEPISFIEAALRRRQRDPPSMAMPC